jgi:tetratricopeptide (TPR) repeat protein
MRFTLCRKMAHRGSSGLSADIRRESLLNAPALMFMSAVILIAFWVLFPRQPAFRDPANLSAKDALSVAYLRVLVQSDPHNVPLRLSFVQLLTEAGMTDEAVSAIRPLRASETALVYEIQLAELKLSLQRLYQHPGGDVEQAVRARIAQLIPSLLRMARNDKELNQVVALAEQFGEPSVLAGTFEQLITLRDESNDKKSRWLISAAHQRMAAAQPRLAARNLCDAFLLERLRDAKRQVAKSCLRAYLEAGLDREALKAAVQVQSVAEGDAELLLLAANIAEPLEDREHALAWLQESSRLSPADMALVERIMRLQVSMGLLNESVARAAQLRTSLVLGSERHRMVARIYDWNAQPDEALALWLSFARQRADQEAEMRAFELARAKPDHAALLQLLEAVMMRRTLTTAEADAYVKAGLSIGQPSHVEAQLRRHAEQFNNPPTAVKALTDVLVLKGDPQAAVTLRQGQPDGENGQQRMELARLLEEAGNVQKSFELLLRDADSPDPSYAEEYWLLLAKVAVRLGKDAYASKAYEKVLSLRPDDVETLEHLQRLAARHRDDKKSEQLAHYGWDRLKRVDDLQRLMRFSWKRENWQELDHWLALADEMRASAPSVMAQAPDYWYFRAMRKMASGERDAARQSLQEILRLRGPDPEVTEAMIWVLLLEAPFDQALLDAVVQPYRGQTGNSAAVSPPLVEALAAAEQALGRPVPAAAWYLRSLGTRPADFLWTLTLADNMEWAGCSAHANHARHAVLQTLAARQSGQKDVKYPKRLAEHVVGLRGARTRPATGDDEKAHQQMQSVQRRWSHLGLGRDLDNARFYALQRQRERLGSPAWERFADAVKNGEEEAISAQLNLISRYLQGQTDESAPAEMLPLSIEDVERANRWLAGKAPPSQNSLDGELDICRQTLAKIRESQRKSPPWKEPAKL